MENWQRFCVVLAMIATLAFGWMLWDSYMTENTVGTYRVVYENHTKSGRCFKSKELATQHPVYVYGKATLVISLNNESVSFELNYNGENTFSLDDDNESANVQVIHKNE